MPFEWFIALRYLREGKSQTALILSAVSIGVSVVVFLSALINGLQTSLVDKTLGSQSHVTLRAPDLVARPLGTVGPGGPGEIHATVILERSPQRLRSIEQWASVIEQLGRIPGVLAVSPTVTGAAFATRSAAEQPVVVRGVDPERFLAVINVEKKLVAGRFSPTGSDVVIGVGLAQLLDVHVGDKLRLDTALRRETVVTVSGVFDLGNEDVNERWVLGSLRLAQTLFDLPGGVSTIELRVAEVFDAETIAEAAAERTGLEATSWMKLNAALLSGLRAQSSSKYMIEFFVVLAVTLGIASVLIVAVVQKAREIGILRAVGTSRSSVLRIFLIQGGLVGLFGSFVGGALGAGFSLFFQRVSANADGTPTVPVQLDVALFFSATLLATGIGLVAAAIPARRAARLDPADVIRNG